MSTNAPKPGTPLTREQVRWVIDRFSELSLRHFRDDGGAFSHDSAAMMIRLEAAIEFERILMGYTQHDGPKAA